MQFKMPFESSSLPGAGLIFQIELLNTGGRVIIFGVVSRVPPRGRRYMYIYIYIYICIYIYIYTHILVHISIKLCFLFCRVFASIPGKSFVQHLLCYRRLCEKVPSAQALAMQDGSINSSPAPDSVFLSFSLSLYIYIYIYTCIGVCVYIYIYI